jgi:hypothetical protein
LAQASSALPPACPSCHGAAAAVPGECYRADDVPVFEKLERAVVAARLSEPTNYRLWVLLSQVSERWRQPETLLRPVIESIPALQFLEDDFAADRMQMARAVGMCLAAITSQLRSAEARRQASHPGMVAEPAQLGPTRG